MYSDREMQWGAQLGYFDFDDNDIPTGDGEKSI